MVNMALTMAHVIVPCLIAMATAAPAAERSSGQEPVVSQTGDGIQLNRAKRSKENVALGDQQTGAGAMASPAKKRSGPFPFPPLAPPQFGSPVSPEAGRYPGKGYEGQADRAGFMYASQQKPVPLDIQEETAAELQAALVPEEAELAKPEEIPEQKIVAESLENKDGHGEPLVGAEMGQEQPQQIPEVGKEPETVPQLPTAEPHNVQTSIVSAATTAVVPEVPSPLKAQLPEDSRKADAEEALHAKDQVTEKDDIDIFLSNLQETKWANPLISHDDNGEEEEKTEQKEAEEKEEKEDNKEGSTEDELMQVVGEKEDAAEKTPEAEDYKKELLKYILMNEDEYEPDPVSFARYPYPDSYYLRRRRRSLARRRLPHIHRRRRSGRGITRAKRTKRELYYNPEALQRAEEEEEKQAELEDLVSYLMALYPALHENQPLPQGSLFPGYFWRQSNYPEEDYPQYPEWVEEPDYMDMALGEWEPPSQPAPAWEPAFYPEEEEEEEESFYPGAEKWQVQGLLPGQRLKRYFFPASREPYAHWGAFLPAQEKRDYDDGYWRLRNLAAMLSDAQSSSPYFDALNIKRKK